VDLRGLLLRGRRRKEGKAEGRGKKGHKGRGNKGARRGIVEGRSRHSLARPF